jgi:hypothetical protein avisC_08547
MHYAQRLLAARPSTRLGARAILGFMTACGVLTSTAGVAAMPLLTESEVVSDTGAANECHPAAFVNYPEGQSKPEYVVPVYETGFGVGIDAVLTGWCHDGGRLLSDPSVTVNVIDGGTVSSYLIPGLKVELDPELGSGEQSAFLPTDYLVKGLREVTGDQSWDVGSKLFSLTYTSGTVSATTGMFSFVKQSPDVISPPSPEPTAEPSEEPSAEPTTVPTAQLTPDPTAGPEPEPTTEPAPEPTQAPSPSPTVMPSAQPTPTVAPDPVSTPTNATCKAEPTVTVLNPDGSDPRGARPVYKPESSIRLSGSNWCGNGTMLEGDKPIEIQLVTYGGYVIPQTASVPVSFTKGSFDARVNLSSLFAGADLETSDYYLWISPIGTGLTRATNVFSYEVPAHDPAPTAGPTAAPTSSPTPSTAPAPDPSPTPSNEPSSVPAVEPSHAPAAQPAQPTGPTSTSGPSIMAGPRGNGADWGSPLSPGPDGTSSGSGGNTASNSGSQGAPGSSRSGAGSPAADVPAEPGTDRERVQDSGQGNASTASDSEESVPSTQPSDEATASEDRTVRPDRNPVPPVTSSAQLSAENAGSLSGSRQGNIVNLVLPKAKVSAGEWVSVFVFPGATTKGWVQVDDTNSVSIDISTLESGSYELAVADRDNSLLGWAKLEITSASFDPRNPAQAQLLTLPDDKEAQTPRGLSVNDMLLGGAGGLLAVGAGSLLVAAYSGMPLRAPRVPRRPRMPRRH